jgi:tripartite ATP-independent transporter DctM subunit
MQNGLNRIVESLDRLLSIILHLLLAAMLATALAQVASRYLLNSPLGWTEELTRLMLIVYTLVGAVTALRTDRHPRMDDLVLRMPMPLQRAMAVLSDAIIVLSCTVLVMHGWRVGQRTISMASAFDIPLKYLYFTLVGVSVLVVVFHWVMSAEKRGWLLSTLSVALGIGAYCYMMNIPAPHIEGASSSAIVVVLMLAFLAMSVPVAFALIGSSLIGLYVDQIATFDMLPQRIVGGMDSFLLIAIPFFLLAGEIMNKGGVTARFVAIAQALVGHLRGGIGQANVVTNLLMSGVSGSSSADCAAVGKLLIPEMKKAGYTGAFAAATTASASILANMLPPSINLLIYAGLASVSVGALFIATIIPGLLLVLTMMIVVYWHARRHNIPRQNERFSGSELGRSLRRGVWALGLPLIVVLGLRAGAFTATEAAAIAAAYSFFVAFFVYRQITLRDLPQISRSVAEDTAVIMLIIAASAPFAWILTVQQVPQTLAAGLGPLMDYPWLLLIAVNLLLIVVGLPLEPAPAMVILVPILMPILAIAGIDPVHFGIVMVFNLFIGALTPPVGNLAFIAAMVAKEKPSAVFWALNPYFLALFISLMVLTFVPSLSLWLPALLRS